MQDCVVGIVPVDEFDGLVGLWGEGQIADQGTGGEFAFDVQLVALAGLLVIQNGAHAEVRNDLLRGDLDLERRLLAAEDPLAALRPEPRAGAEAAPAASLAQRVVGTGARRSTVPTAAAVPAARADDITKATQASVKLRPKSLDTYTSID